MMRKDIKLSKRKLESYKRAEIVCRELRYQIANWREHDMTKIADLVIKWMDVTGKIKFDRPNHFKRKKHE